MSAKTSLPVSFLIVCAAACASAPKHSASAPEAEIAAEPVRPAPPQASPTTKAAEALLAKGDAAGARDKFILALKENPRDARAALGLGLAWESLGDMGEAERAYREAIGIDDNLAEAHNNLGLVLRDKRQDEQAMSELQRAVQLDPKLASAQANLALAYEDAGKTEDARAAYAKAVTLAPKDAVLHANYGLFLLNAGDSDEAVKVLRKGLAQASGDRAALLALGNGLRRAGKPDEAVRALRSAIEANGGKPTVALLSELALAQNAAGNEADAKASLEQALDLDPNYATAHYLLGSLLASEGDKRGATEHYKRTIALDPKGELAARAKQKLEALKAQKEK